MGEQVLIFNFSEDEKQQNELWFDGCANLFHIFYMGEQVLIFIFSEDEKQQNELWFDGDIILILRHSKTKCIDPWIILMLPHASLMRHL